MLNGLPWKWTEIILLFVKSHPNTAFQTLVDPEGYSISSKRFLLSNHKIYYNKCYVNEISLHKNILLYKFDAFFIITKQLSWRVGHNWATELNWTEALITHSDYKFYSLRCDDPKVTAKLDFFFLLYDFTNRGSILTIDLSNLNMTFFFLLSQELPHFSLEELHSFS